MTRPRILKPPRAVAFLACRRANLGHAWFDYNETDMPRPQYGVRLSCRCERCGTTRHHIVDSLGQISQRRYIYPDGYAMAEKVPSEKLRRDYVRLLKAQMRRAS